MKDRRSGSGGPGPGRSYMSDVLKAAAHPTRQAVLRILEKSPHTTVELEKETGENRYHLYHHLSVLEAAGLIASRVTGKSKEFSLLKPKRPEAVYLELHAEDPHEGAKLKRLLEVVAVVAEGGIPHLDKVTRARLMLSYPWSPEEES
jgi:DNA-binding transcriptional ArsR family regulator